MDLRYGPFLGLTRIERWNRAEKLGLHPPQYIREIILKQNLPDEHAWSKIL